MGLTIVEYTKGVISSMTNLTKDPKQYAKLLLSVSEPQRKIEQERPLDPFECAQMIKRLMDEEGDTKSQISARIGLMGITADPSKTSTLRLNQFLALLNISKKSRSFAGWPWEGYPKIRFPLLSDLSPLSPDEQDLVIQSVYNNERKYVSLFKPETRENSPCRPRLEIGNASQYDRKRLLTTYAAKVASYKENGTKSSIRKYIKDFLGLKPVDITTHMIICDAPRTLLYTPEYFRSNDEYKKILVHILYCRS